MGNTGFWSWVREADVVRDVERLAEDVGDLGEFDYSRTLEQLEAADLEVV